MTRVKVERFKEEFDERSYQSEKEKVVLYEQVFEDIELPELIRQLNKSNL